MKLSHASFAHKLDKMQLHKPMILLPAVRKEV